MKTQHNHLAFLGILLAGSVVMAYWFYTQNHSAQTVSPLATTTTPTITEKPVNRPSATKETTYTTTNLGNFTFSHPASITPSGFKWESNTPFPGTLSVRFPGTLNDTYVWIFTDVNQPQVPTSSFNPEAEKLSDYTQGYLISRPYMKEFATIHGIKRLETALEVVVHESEEKTVNGIPMLRQRYSLGTWTLNHDGDRVFSTRTEGELESYWRYVFFDGKTFVIVTSESIDALDSLMKSVRVKI